MIQFYVEIILFEDGSASIHGDTYTLKGYLPIMADNERDAVEIAEATMTLDHENSFSRIFVGKARITPISKEKWNYFYER